MFIDLRSDTVTKPSSDMRKAMANAEVGDDVYGEDPTVIELEQTVAAKLGKEAALFVPSGTMANQLCLMLHTRPGESVIVPKDAHLVRYESGAAAAFSSVQLSETTSFAPSRDELEDLYRQESIATSRTSLITLENTHNHAGGRILPMTSSRAVHDFARNKGLATHLDGARLWNTHVATGVALPELTQGFDTVSVCFSKGLGAPVGSAIGTSRDAVAKLRGLRKRMGGGLRQSGIIAAGALYAVENHLDDLREDHQKAKTFWSTLRDHQPSAVSEFAPETNLVIVLVRDPDRATAQLRNEGVLVGQWTSKSIRVAFHRDVNEDALATALRSFLKVL